MAINQGAKALKRGAEKVKNAGNGGHYADMASPEGIKAGKTVDNFIASGGQGRLSQNADVAAANTTGKRLSDLGGAAMGSYQNAAMSEGRSALGLMGKHMVQGAGSGALVGGGIEASQGGSFWDGAKQGAFNGAVGMTAVRGAKRMSGAQSYIGKNGIRASASNMWGATSNNAQVSKQAVASISQTQRDGMVRSIMNQNSRKAKQV